MVINGLEIVSIFDMAHIFECIRNNLIDKHLEVDSKPIKMPKGKNLQSRITFEKPVVCTDDCPEKLKNSLRNILMRTN